MAVRLAHHRRVATAALLLCFMLATMLLTLGSSGPAPEAGRDGGGDDPGGLTADAVIPVGAGTTREIGSLAEWDLAVASAKPGDVLRLRADIPAALVYQGGHDGSGGSGGDGTAQAPIVITAEPGVWIDPGNQNGGRGALDVIAADHVHVVGVSVRNAQFGIRCLQCRGSVDQPVRIAANRVTLTGHAGIHVGGHPASYAPSAWLVVEDNVVDLTGRTAPASGEGIYLGSGRAEWADTTGDVTVRANDISRTGAEGIDIKPGTRGITVEGNAIHDLAPLRGGAISAHYVNRAPNPHPARFDAVTLRANRIWNLNLGGTPGSSDSAIWVGHGGVDVVGNWIWGLRGEPAAARAVWVRSTQDFGPHPIQIRGNVFWAVQGWVAEGQPSGAAIVMASGNRGIDPGSSELVVDAASFPGPVPAIGSGGTADAGAGPGSGLGWTGPTPAASTTTGAPGGSAARSGSGSPAPLGQAPPTDLLAYQDPAATRGGPPEADGVAAPPPAVTSPSSGGGTPLAPAAGYGIVGALALAAVGLGGRAKTGEGTV